MTQDEILVLLRKLARVLEGNAHDVYPVDLGKVKAAIESIESLRKGRRLDD